MRIASVYYINSLPFIQKIDSHSLHFDAPAKLYPYLKQHQADVALLPIVNSFLDHDLKICSSYGICSKGPVKSVLLKSKANLKFEQLKKIKLDSESLSSQTLLKILLKFKYQLKLEQIEFSEHFSSSEADAELQIGNKAFVAHELFTNEIDLALEWSDWQKLPFVFATWMSYSADQTKLDALLSNSLNYFFNHLEEEIEKIQKEFPHLSKKLLKEYFTKNIHYQMGESEIKAIEVFKKFYQELHL